MIKTTNKHPHPRTCSKRYYWLFITTLICLFITSIGNTAVIEHQLQINFSYDTQAVPDKQVTGYRLYMEGDLVCETAQVTPQIQSIACTVVSESGTYAFTLSAIFDDNSEGPQSAPFLFNLALSIIEPPKAVLSSSTAAGNAPLLVTFDGTSSTTSNPPIVSYNWRFDDGSQATGETASHTYSTAGTYYAELTVTDRLGLTDKVNTPIIVLGTVAPNKKPIAVISTDSIEGNVPLSLSFDGSQSSDPDGSIVRYDWNFGDGTIGTGPSVQHTYTDAALYTMSLQVIDNIGGTATITREIICNTVAPGTIPTFEVGEISIDHEWVNVLFENNFNHPVVIAGPPTFNGSNPVLVRIRNIDQKGFKIRLQEWDYLEDNHVEETFSYIVMEKGAYTLDSGMKIEAGSFTGSSKRQKISLLQKYSTPPVLLTQIISGDDPDAVTGRIYKIKRKSFKYLMQEQQTTRSSHTPETIGYIAWEPGIGEISGLIFETRKTRKKVKHKWYNLTFKTEFPAQPLFIADMQTYKGGDTAAVRAHDLSRTSTQIKVEEEQSKDNEIKHNKEVIGYLVIGSATAATE